MSVRADTSKERTVTQVIEAEKKASASVSVTQLSGQMEGSRKQNSRLEVVTKDRGPMLSFLAMRTEQGYSFRISSDDEILNGTPWSAEEKLLTYKDTGHRRTVGEPPELRIELRCRREDLHITGIELTDKGKPFYQLSANHQLAIEQYLKAELLRVGFIVGDVSDPFSEVILADVTPEEE